MSRPTKADEKRPEKVKRDTRLSWRPRHLPGNIYCSPACGLGCRHEDYLEAVREAKEAADRMPGFKPVVFENLGWHWELVAVNGYVSIGSGGWFSAYISDEPDNPGGGIWVARGKTPVAALKAVLKKANGELARMSRAVEAARLCLAGVAGVRKGKPARKRACFR